MEGGGGWFTAIGCAFKIKGGGGLVHGHEEGVEQDDDHDEHLKASARNQAAIKRKINKRKKRGVRYVLCVSL